MSNKIEKLNNNESNYDNKSYQQLTKLLSFRIRKRLLARHAIKVQQQHLNNKTAPSQIQLDNFFTPYSYSTKFLTTMDEILVETQIKIMEAISSENEDKVIKLDEDIEKIRKSLEKFKQKEDIQKLCSDFDNIESKKLNKRFNQTLNKTKKENQTFLATYENKICDDMLSDQSIISSNSANSESSKRSNKSTSDKSKQFKNNKNKRGEKQTNFNNNKPILKNSNTSRSSSSNSQNRNNTPTRKFNRNTGSYSNQNQLYNQYTNNNFRNQQQERVRTNEISSNNNYNSNSYNNHNNNNSYNNSNGYNRNNGYNNNNNYNNYTDNVNNQSRNYNNSFQQNNDQRVNFRLPGQNRMKI